MTLTGNYRPVLRTANGTFNLTLSTHPEGVPSEIKGLWNAKLNNGVLSQFKLRDRRNGALLTFQLRIEAVGQTNGDIQGNIIFLGRQRN